MTTLNSSLPRVSRFRSSLSRKPLYASVLFAFMVTGFVISLVKTINYLFGLFEDAVIVKNSFTYYPPEGIELLYLFGSAFLSILFFVFSSYILTIVKNKVMRSKFVEFVQASVVGLVFMTCLVMPSMGVMQITYVNSDSSQIVVSSTLGNNYETIKSGYDNIYKTPDGKVYEFTTIHSEGNAITKTLEEVK
jgi:hypothetical protein